MVSRFFASGNGAHVERSSTAHSQGGIAGQDIGRSAGRVSDKIPSQKFSSKVFKAKKQILRLTTPKLKDVWGPVRSE